MTHTAGKDPVAPEVLLRPRHTEWSLFVACTAAILAFAFAAVAVYWADQANQRSNRDHNAKIGAQQALSTANSSLTRNGLSPVPTPTGIASPTPAPTVTVTQTGPRGERGPSPSKADLASVVSAYCATVHCGAGPTPAQVIAAVATYCNANGRCAGPEGPPGEPAPPASADQLAAAVSSYCGDHGNCEGPAGADATQEQVAQAVADYCTAHSNCQGPVAPPQPFSWTYTVPGDGLARPDRTFTTTCRWGDSGYTCTTKET